MVKKTLALFAAALIILAVVLTARSYTAWNKPSSPEASDTNPVQTTSTAKPLPDTSSDSIQEDQSSTQEETVPPPEAADVSPVQTTGTSKPLPDASNDSMQEDQSSTQEEAVPPPGVPVTEPADKGFRFVVMADSRGLDKGVNSKVVKKIMQGIKQLSPQPEFAIMPGDLVDGAKSYSDLKVQLEYFKSIVTQFYPADFFYPGIGNHEMRAGPDSDKIFSEVFSEFNAEFMKDYNKTAYYFDRNGIRFFMLNSNHAGEPHRVSDKQLEWLNSNIDEASNHNLFFMHEPPYPTGAGVGSSLDANHLQRDKLWQVIDSAKGAMVFCGHEHNYTRRHIDSSFNENYKGVDFIYNNLVYQLTVGSFGAPLYTQYTSKKGVDVPPVVEYHFAVVDVNADKVKVTVYSIDGKIIDSFEQ